MAGKKKYVVPNVELCNNFSTNVIMASNAWFSDEYDNLVGGSSWSGRILD